MSTRLIWIAFSLLLSGSVHVVAAGWLRRSYPKLSKRLVYGLAAFFTVFPSLMRAWVVAAPSRFVVIMVAISIVEVFAVFFALIPTAIVSLLARFAPKKKQPDGTLVDRRQAISRIAGTTAFGAAAVTLGWGATRGRHGFTIEEVVVKIPNWPKALEGYTIAQISDVHVGAFTGERELAEGLELIRRVKPDLVVATGDLVDHESVDADAIAAMLAAVNARDGAYAIVGNHDHYAGPADVARRFAAAKVRLLVNEGITIRDAFALLGVDDMNGRLRAQPGFAGPDLAKAINMVRPDLPRILLAHQPKYFREARGRVALQLSGHTHGGQINPGFTPAKIFMPYVSGRYVEEESTLWVNRGFGVVGPPARIGAPPEITRIVIVSV